MNSENAAIAAANRSGEHTIFERRRLEEQYENLDQQHQAASLGMWVFLATEVMFFGTLFLSVAVYRFLYTEEFEKASERLNWLIGGINTLVLLLSSLMIVLAVHYAQHGQSQADRPLSRPDGPAGSLLPVPQGSGILHRLRENLIPGWRFDADEWITQAGLRPDQVPHVKLFLFLYWVMTGLHALHVTIGIGAVLVILVLAWRGRFSAAYYTPVDVTALYWHFVDIVWIFLLPTLYLLGTHYAK